MSLRWLKYNNMLQYTNIVMIATKTVYQIIFGFYCIEFLYTSKVFAGELKKSLDEEIIQGILLV